MTTPHDAVQVLNEALEADRMAIQTLFGFRCPANDALCDHPTIQVGTPPGASGPMVGPLGLINGLFGARENGWGFIGANVDHEGFIVDFVVVDG